MVTLTRHNVTVTCTLPGKKNKIKFTLEDALEAHRENISVALLFL